MDFGGTGGVAKNDRCELGVDEPLLPSRSGGGDNALFGPHTTFTGVKGMGVVGVEVQSRWEGGEVRGFTGGGSVNLAFIP